MKKKILSLIMSATLLAGLMLINIQAQELDEEQLQTEATSSDADAYVSDVIETEEEILAEDTFEVEANQVEINAVNFPDENFRQYIKQNYDKNNDGIVDNIENIKTIDVHSRGIYSLKGIELFGALERLYCSENQLTSLDVSKNTALVVLGCSGNQLTSLDVSKNTSLENLSCSNNHLTSLDVSKNTALLVLYCYNNQLTSLDVSKNTALDWLYCYDNQLTKLDVSKNTALRELSCYENQLTSLDVSKNTALLLLMCYNNQLTSLDVSQNTALKYLVINNNMTTDISDSNLSMLWIFVPELKGTVDLSNITGIEKYMSGSDWNANTKKLTYELEIFDDYRASCMISGSTTTGLGYEGHFASYQGYKFYKDFNGDIRCHDSNGNPVINEFKCDGTYTYYFQLDGTAMKNRLTYHPDGKHVIYFDENGHEVFSNFHHVEKSIAGDAVDDFCFFDVYGYMYVDVMTYDQAGEKLYYVNPYGVIERGKWFEFSDTCVWAGTTDKVGTGYGYANADGTLMINTHTYDWLGRYVYMQGNGHMQ